MNYLMQQEKARTVTQYLAQQPAYYKAFQHDCGLIDYTCSQSQQIGDKIKFLFRQILLGYFSTQTIAHYLQALELLSELKSKGIIFQKRDLRFVQICQLYLVDEKTNYYCTILSQKYQNIFE